MTFCIGITNNLPDCRYVFFWEYDYKNEHMDFADVCEEARFVSQVVGIDIDILESSPDNYHLVSYDILTRDELLTAQRYMTGIDHYLAIDEIALYRDHSTGNNLRLGEKNRKKSPRFLKRFFNNEGHQKSLQHFLWYRFFCNVPDFDFAPNCLVCDSRCVLYPLHLFCYRESHFLDLHARIVVYETDITRVRVAEVRHQLLALAHRRCDKAEQKLEKHQNRKLFIES